MHFHLLQLLLQFLHADAISCAAAGSAAVDCAAAAVATADNSAVDQAVVDVARRTATVSQQCNSERRRFVCVYHVLNSIGSR